MSVLVRVLPSLVKGLAATNGKKTMWGAILTAGGIGMSFIPHLETVAVNTLIAGVPILATGIIHKIVKRKQKKEN